MRSTTQCMARLDVVDDEGVLGQTVMVLDDTLIHFAPSDSGVMLGEHETFTDEEHSLVADLRAIGTKINSSFEGRWQPYTASFASA